MSNLDDTTIRDFGGGWDVADSDKSLSSRFQPVSDNIIRGTDGHFKVRFGNKLFADAKKGVETVLAPASYTITTVSASAVVKITKNAHGYTSGQHVSITGFTLFNGVTADAMNRTHGIVVNDANNFSVYVRTAANASGGTVQTLGITHDTHALGGRDIFGRYYKDNMIVFSDTGEIVSINSSGVATAIWNYAIANALTLPPWAQCKRVSAEIVRGRLIAVNGAANDKPLAIDGTTVNYLVDASSLSNGAIPRAEFVIAAGQYVVLVNTEYGPTKLEIGAKNTVMTCSREVSPSDAVEFDVGMMTQTIDSTILGASVVRSRVFIGYSDRTMLGTLGIYTGANHEPDFNDNIAEFGTFSHASIISLGNDLFCAGMNGINSVEISRASGEFVPATISDLIHPVLLRHFARLTEDDRRYRTFAVFDNNTRSYMLFVPKYSATSATMGTDPIYATTTLQPHNLMYLRYRNHALDEGDYVDIAGATDFNALLTGAMVNGRRRIRHIVDKDTIVIEVDAYPANTNEAFGGNAITISPVNDETVGYVFEYNPRLKIRRWTRFRNMNFMWGARSQLNRLFFGNGNGKVFQYGSEYEPFSADSMGDYDDLTYQTSHAYTVGTRVLDSTDGLVYKCLVAHTSHASNTFPQARAANDTYWTEYLGEEIAFDLETSWTDLKARLANKEIELVSFDTEGSASFTFSVFTNSMRKHFESYDLIPVRSTEFVGQDTPGFGAGNQPFGGGRNTLQEWLHSFPVTAKLFRFRFHGSTIHPLKITAVTFYYKKSRALT